MPDKSALEKKYKAFRRGLREDMTITGVGRLGTIPPRAQQRECAAISLGDGAFRHL